MFCDVGRLSAFAEDMVDPAIYQANEGQELLAASIVAFILHSYPLVQESCPHAHPKYMPAVCG